MIPKAIFSIAAAVLATVPLAHAQTFTDCNPLEKTCPPNPALGGSSRTDFTKGDDHSFFQVLSGTKLKYDAQRGAIFSIANENEAPTIASNQCIFFGKLEVELQAAPGAGIVTSVVLQSADLDEIDWEWVGNDPNRVQTNYFSKGNTTTYDRGRYHDLPETTSKFYKYGIEWTTEAITFSVNDSPLRVVTWAEAYNGRTFPQTPMQVKLGTWVGGRSTASPGTVEWAGGLADFSKGPFLGYYKSISVTDYSNGVAGAKQYVWGDRSGTYGSIIVDTKGHAGGGGDDSSPIPVAGGSPVGSSPAQGIENTPVKLAPINTRAEPSTSLETITTLATTTATVHTGSTRPSDTTMSTVSLLPEQRTSTMATSPDSPATAPAKASATSGGAIDVPAAAPRAGMTAPLAATLAVVASGFLVAQLLV